MQYKHAVINTNSKVRECATRGVRGGPGSPNILGKFHHITLGPPQWLLCCACPVITWYCNFNRIKNVKWSKWWLSSFQIPGIAIIISLPSNPGVLILLRFHHKVVKGCPEMNFGGKRVENKEKWFFGQKRSFASGSQPKSWESWKKLYLRNRRSDFNKVFSVFPVFSNAKISASCHQDSTTFVLGWFSKFILMTAQHNNGDWMASMLARFSTYVGYIEHSFWTSND